MRNGNPHVYDEFVFPGLSINECFDAANECRHGNLPFDPDLDCRCWNVRRKLRQHGTAGKPRPSYSAHVKRRAVQLYADGESSRQVAAMFGASQRTVLGWVKAARVPVRGRGRPWQKREAA